MSASFNDKKEICLIKDYWLISTGMDTSACEGAPPLVPQPSNHGLRFPPDNYSGFIETTPTPSSIAASMALVKRVFHSFLL